MNVDLPQPEGPIIAVTALALIFRLMFFRACFVPNHALSSMLCIFTSVIPEFILRFAPYLLFLRLYSGLKPLRLKSMMLPTLELVFQEMVDVNSERFSEATHPLVD
jgi:hypothetical protein